jgi:hypothetical protein
MRTGAAPAARASVQFLKAPLLRVLPCALVFNGARPWAEGYDSDTGDLAGLRWQW